MQSIQVWTYVYVTVCPKVHQVPQQSLTQTHVTARGSRAATLGAGITIENEGTYNTAMGRPTKVSG